MADSDYYDREADRYDETRGGPVRAEAAAVAVARLVSPGRLLDVAGGTGIVSAALAARGFDVLVADLSTGMLRLAAARLPGRVLVASGDRLPVRDGSVDVVTTVWLLHMLPTPVADAVLGEAARVLHTGGRFVTTVDKGQAHGHDGAESDDADRVRRTAADLGLAPAGATTFSGPSTWGSATDADPVFPLVAFRKG
jgi:ubiquinone/menaquinone biosynthesis C-methylase UbiE